MRRLLLDLIARIDAKIGEIRQLIVTERRHVTGP